MWDGRQRRNNACVGLAFWAGWSTIPACMARRRVNKSATKRRTSALHKRPGKQGKLPKDAVTLIVILSAREGQESLLEAELRALVGPTRREDGCLTYELHRGADTPSALLLHEVWASREHHRLHTQTPHFLRWNARKDALLVSRDAMFWRLIV